MANIRNNPLYMTWDSMKSRCYNPNHHSYKYYGAKGITIAEEWRTDFSVFNAAVGPRPEGMTLDRIDGTRGYEPGNVRWASSKEQAENRPSTNFFTYNGETHSIFDWAKIFECDSGSLKERWEKTGEPGKLKNPQGFGTITFESNTQKWRARMPAKLGRKTIGFYSTREEAPNTRRLVITQG
jgi:hypothetical protein